MKLASEVSFKPSLDHLIHQVYNGGKSDTGLLIYFTVATLFSECLVDAALLFALFKRHKVWLARLTLFPLGLPDDSVTAPKVLSEELFVQLKEEIAKNGFNE